MDCVASPAAIVQTIIELMDCDSKDEQFDDVVTVLALKLPRLQRNRIPKYCEEVLSRYFNFELKRLFRLSRETFHKLVLDYMASPFFPQEDDQSMYNLADRFNLAVSTVHSSVEQMLDFLNSMSAEVIVWPHRQEQERSKTGFLVKSAGKGPQNTIGCIDGCHIEITKPTESPSSYYTLVKEEVDARIGFLETAPKGQSVPSFSAAPNT
ncbi:hypothetical protein HPB50_003642 [Hyalomma asiaticum]|uniref:Uncharacterized protein n=1 Tax=Hyalomma asiaticum TaxID=266040 RepID=A0ACB7SBE9_HYAAI|nr:hypothetical protein HPB50_003642 [Hyalomma asiaticum]